MIYQIDSKIANQVGFVGAIIFHHICFWIKKNKANEKHFHDGEYWTYSSITGFSKYFEDLTPRQIKQGLLNLKEKGFLKCGNFNKNPYDKTNWYALDKKGYSIEQNCPLDETKVSNRTDGSVQPIPDIITDNITDIKEEIHKEEKDLVLDLKQEDFNDQSKDSTKTCSVIAPKSDCNSKGEQVSQLKKKTDCRAFLESIEEIYNAYPRHDGKKVALQAIQKAVKNGYTLEYLLQRTRLYAQKIQWKEKQFIPMASTWFNQERFTDDASTWESEQPKQQSYSLKKPLAKGYTPEQEAKLHEMFDRDQKLNPNKKDDSYDFFFPNRK